MKSLLINIVTTFFLSIFFSFFWVYTIVPTDLKAKLINVAENKASEALEKLITLHEKQDIQRNLLLSINDQLKINMRDVCVEEMQCKCNWFDYNREKNKIE